MKIIAHRRNTIRELEDTPTSYGVEVDIRSVGDRMIIHHDPFSAGEDFCEWADHYRHGTLILNVKEEGLEDRLLEEMEKRSIDDFFFLDQSFPFLMRSVRAGEKRCAVRVSEYESLDTALSLAGKINWVWVDCFTRFPLTKDDATKLRDGGFRLCVVSPELQGREAAEGIPAMRSLLEEREILTDAVCTKTPHLWL